MQDKRLTPLEPSDVSELCYTFARQLGFVLDELCCQGLDVWRDEDYRWQWRWLGTDLHAERGFWALGEAVVDAVVRRYPGTFGVEG